MENKKNRITLIEPSQIISEGLSIIIESSREFTIKDRLNDLSYSRANSNTTDMIIINPAVIDFGLRSDIRPLFSHLGKKIPIVAIDYGPFDSTTMHQYDGYISILDTKQQIIKKLHTAIESLRAHPKSESNDLSIREKSILTSVAKGKTNKEIADEFNISIYTVVTHRKNISRKLGINSVSGLTVYAIMNKLIDMSEF